LEDKADGNSLKVYDLENDQTYNSSIMDIAYCNDTVKYEWTFTVPDAEKN